MDININRSFTTEDLLKEDIKLEVLKEAVVQTLEKYDIRYI